MVPVLPRGIIALILDSLDNNARRILTLDISVKLIDAYNVTSQMIFELDVECIDFL